MYYILKKHSRRLLAVASALLMVAFLIPTVGKMGNDDNVIGQANGKKIRYSELRQAESQWDLLRSRIGVPTGGSGQLQLQPLALQMGEYAYGEIEEHPETFLLLKLESRKLGIFVSDERVESLFQQVQVRGLDMSRLDNIEVVKAALRSFLEVADTFERTASAVRVSEPMRQHQLATAFQQVSVSAVDFPAAEFLAQVPAPSAEDLQRHFEKYKDIDPQSPSAVSKENPFGFGYRYPQRVTFQYVMVPTDQVRKVVEASRTPERWKVDARKFYLQNQARFTTTTQPATDELTLGPTSKPAAKATTRPFEDAAKDAMEAIIKPEVEKLQIAIAGRISAIFAGDWNTFSASKATSRPGSSLGVAYDSYEYLQKLAQEIQRQYKVAVTIEQYPTPLSARDLELTGKVGQAFTATQVPFALYVTMDEAARKERLRQNPAIPPVLHPWQPSTLLRDAAGDLFIFRRTSVDPAHTPQTLKEVAAQVEKDWKQQQAMELAAKAAADLIAKVGQADLKQAAQAARKTVVDTGFFSNGGVAMGLHLDDRASKEFTSEAMTTLLQKKAAGEDTLAAIPVHSAGRVIVTRLDEVKRTWTDENLPMLATYLRREAASQLAAPLQTEWFGFANVAQRMDYIPVARSSAPEQDQPAAPTPRPLGI